jgi:hypothetical protein
VEVPMLTFTPFATEWAPTGQVKLREHCPMTADFDKLNFAEFETYLKSSTSMKCMKTISYAVMNLRRFFGLLEVPHDVDFIALMCGLYEHNIVHHAATLKLLDLKYGWSRQVL